MAEDPDTPQTRGDAAAAIPADGPGTGRVGLDQRRILGAAVQFIEENGLQALTMQRLGAYLGVEGMDIDMAVGSFLTPSDLQNLPIWGFTLIISGAVFARPGKDRTAVA